MLNTEPTHQWAVTVRTKDGFPVASFHVYGADKHLARLSVPAVYRYDNRLTVGLRRVYAPVVTPN